MKYQAPKPIERKEAATAFQNENIKAICDALIRIAFHDSDWRWVQTQCLMFLKHPHADVRGLAATCLGHLARIHGQLDLGLVKPALQKLTKDPDIGGRAEDALDDIRMHLEGHKKTKKP